MAKSTLKKTSKRNTTYKEAYKTDLWRKYITSRPKNVPLTDEEIMEEVSAVRYAR